MELRKETYIMAPEAELLAILDQADAELRKCIRATYGSRSYHFGQDPARYRREALGKVRILVQEAITALLTMAQVGEIV